MLARALTESILLAGLVALAVWAARKRWRTATGEERERAWSGVRGALVAIRFALALLLAAIMLGGSFLLFISSEIGGEDLCRFAQAQLEDIAGQRVSIGHCSVDPLGTQVVIDDVSVGPPDHVLFAAERLSAGLDQARMLTGKVRLDATIVRPRIQLDLSSPTRSRSSPTRPASAACLPDLGNLEIGKLNVKEGSLHVLLPGDRGLALEGLKVSIRGQGYQQLALNVSAARSTLADEAGATTATTTQVTAYVDFAKGTARFEHVELSGPEGGIKADGELGNVCALEGSANAVVNLDFGLLHNHLLRSIDNLSGKAALSATVKFKDHDFAADVKADLTDSSILTFEPGTLSVDAHATLEKLTINKLKLPMEGGTVVATGTLELTSPFRLDASASLDGFSLGEVLERVGVESLPVHLLGSGTARIAGPLVTPDGFDLSGVVDVKVKEFGVYSRSWRRRKSQGTQRFAGFTNGTLKTSYHLTKQQVDLSHTRISTHGSDLTVDGSVYFDVDRGLDLKIDAPRIAIGELGPFAGTDVQGQGRLTARLSGPYMSLDIKGSPSLGNVRVLGYELGNVTGNVDLNLGDRVLTATNIEAEKGESAYEGNGRMTFGDEVELETRIRLDSASASDLMGIASAKFPALEQLALEVEGTLTGDVELSGPATRPNLTAQLKLAGINLYGQHFETGVVRAKIIEAKELEVSTQLNRGTAEVNAKGSMRFSDGAVTLSAATRGFDTSDIDMLADRMPQLSGSLGLTIQADGTLQHPRAKGHLKIRDCYMGDQPIASTVVELGLDGDVLTAEGNVVSPWPRTGAVKEPTPTPADPLPRPSGSMSERINARVEMHDDWPYRFEGEFSVPDVSVLMKKDAGVAAVLAGNIRAEGQLKKVLTSTKAQLELTDFGVTLDRDAFHNIEPVHAQFADGVLTFDAFPLKGDLIELNASGAWTLVNKQGEFDLGGQKNIGITGSLDLSILKHSISELDEASGTLSVNLRAQSDHSVRVNVTDPTIERWLANVTGTAELHDVVLRRRRIPIALADGNGTISLRLPIGRTVDGTIGMFDGSATIDQLEARVNNTGRLAMEGEVNLDQRMIRDADFKIQLDSIPLRVAETDVVFSGTPEIKRREIVRSEVDDSDSEAAVVVHPEVFENVLDGDATVDHLLYTQDLDLDRTLASLIDFSRRPPAPAVFAKDGDNLKLAMGIKCGNVQVSNNLLKSKLDCALHLTGTPKHPGLTGTVSLSDAHASIRNVDYTVSSGVVNFIDGSGIRPTFDIRADSLVSHEQVDYHIHVGAQGTPQAPKLLLTCEPFLAEADILTLITVGVLNSDIQKGGAFSLIGVGIQDAVQTSGISEQLKKLLPGSTTMSLPTFHVTSGYIEQTGVIEPVGELDINLNDRVKVRGQTSLLGPRGRKAEIDTKVRKSVDVQTQWDGDKPSAPSYGDIGSDVRWHWERQ